MIVILEGVMVSFETQETDFKNKKKKKKQKKNPNLRVVW